MYIILILAIATIIVLALMTTAEKPVEVLNKEPVEIQITFDRYDQEYEDYFVLKNKEIKVKLLEPYGGDTLKGTKRFNRSYPHQKRSGHDPRYKDHGRKAHKGDVKLVW